MVASGGGALSLGHCFSPSELEPLDFLLVSNSNSISTRPKSPELALSLRLGPTATHKEPQRDKLANLSPQLTSGSLRPAGKQMGASRGAAVGGNWNWSAANWKSARRVRLANWPTGRLADWTLADGRPTVVELPGGQVAKPPSC